MERIKIVVDADVLIHFSEVNYLALLPDIFTEYDYVVLSTVYNEIKSVKTTLDKVCQLRKNISVNEFRPTGEMMREYAILTSTCGRGESACMAYCKFTKNVVGSSNLKDIKDYCNENKITYLTTLDFLYYAWQRGKLSEKEVDDAIEELISKNHKVPRTKIKEYTPTAQL
jgi:predicted nucleic acid-binding protein